MSNAYDPRLTITGEGRPVVLVPGMDGTGRLFYRQVARLAPEYRVATYALRDSAESMDLLVDDLASIVRQVSPEEGRAVVIGESFGGALALTLAAERPECVRSLVILNSFPYFEPQFRLRLALAGLRTMPWGMMGAVRRLTAFRLHSPHTHGDEIRQFMRLTAAASRTGYLNRLRILQRWDMRPRLANIAAETLFLAADQDHLVPAVAQAQIMAARVPKSTVRVLNGHGHICLIAPDVDLAQILADWQRTSAVRSAANGPTPRVSNFPH
jgi:pimeloyl-ACP methyl ester carboxylesterase